MPGKKIKKTTIVHAHPMHIPPSKKHPLGGITTRKQHPRNIYTAYDKEELKNIFQNASLKKTIYPTSNKLNFPDGNKYDDLIAFWVDHFNKLFPSKPPYSQLDPNVIKALIASESKFESNPKNSGAIGITQITRQTLVALQNPNGEIKDQLFKGIRQKDLLDPDIAIPCGVRWIFQKKALAENRLGHPPTPEEIILEYKGLLKSKTKFHDNAIKNYRDNYAKLIKK